MGRPKTQDDGEQAIAVLPEEEQVIQKKTPIIGFTPDAPVKERQANIVLKLVDDHRKGGAYIDGEDFVYDPETKKQRKVRLLNGVSTIFVDEQKDIDKEYIARNKRSLEFSKLGRQCTLQPHDQTAIQFANLCNSNIENNSRFGVKPIYFTIWNPLAEEHKAQAETDAITEAVILASTMPFEKAKRLCVYLGISLADEFGVPYETAGLKKLLVAFAYKNANKFIKSSENPTVDISWSIKILINKGEIDLDKQAGQAFYKDGGYITTIPTGENAADYLIKYAMTDGESNKAFADRVKMLTQ